MTRKRRRYDPAALVGTVWDIASESVYYNGQEAPQTFRVRLEHPEWPSSAELVVIVDPDRGPIAAGLGVDTRTRRRLGSLADPPSYRELDALVTNTIDLASLLARMTADAVGVWHARRARSILMGSVEDGEELPPEVVRSVLTGHDSLRDEMAAAAIDRTNPRRRRVVTRQHLADVAEVYRRMLDDGYAPTKGVAEHFVTSHSTAARWVGMAREAGLLGPATGTRPGEGELDG